MGITEIFASLGDNPYFGAGAGLVGIGVVMSVARQGAVYGQVLLRRQLLMTLEISSKDESYKWLLNWISTHGMRSQHLSVNTKFTQSPTGKISTKFDFIPSPGMHFFKFRNTWIKVERLREGKIVDMNTGQPFETVQLQAIGRNREIYFDILEEARQLAVLKTEGKTVLYKAFGGHWDQFGFARERRPISSVILDRDIGETIVSDVREFIQSAKWYRDRGIPYRRGYLLHGPPGCGKSSYITALAGELEYGICLLNLNETSVTDDMLVHLLAVAPPETIILLEDIDAAFVSREHRQQNPAAYAGMGHLTFSGLLNALDGVAAAEGRIVFMTTNHIDRLDAALIRPGRADIKMYIGHCSAHQLERMFCRFYPEETAARAKLFAQKVLTSSADVSAAQVQGLFMFNKNNAQGAIDSAGDINGLEYKTILKSASDGV